jgi:hypothetical protein
MIALARTSSPDRHTLHRPDVVEQPPARDLVAEARERERVAFGHDEVGQQRLRSREFQALERLTRGFVSPVAAVQQSVDRARVYEDPRHRLISPAGEVAVVQ